jgi:hypothetical protein
MNPVLPSRHFAGRARYHMGRWHVTDAAGVRASVPAYVTGTGPVRTAAMRGPMVVHSA